MQTCNCSL